MHCAARPGRFGHYLFVYDGRTGVATVIEPLIHNGAGWSFTLPPGQVLRAIADDGTILGGAMLNGVEHGYMLVPDTQ